MTDEHSRLTAELKATKAALATATQTITTLEQAVAALRRILKERGLCGQGE